MDHRGGPPVRIRRAYRIDPTSDRRRRPVRGCAKRTTKSPWAGNMPQDQRTRGRSLQGIHLQNRSMAVGAWGLELAAAAGHPVREGEGYALDRYNPSESASRWVETVTAEAEFASR